MQTKLTLTMDRLAIEGAKYYAKEHHTSLSRMVQTFFSGLTKTETGGVDLSGVLRELSGVLKDENVKDVKIDKQNRLVRRFES